ncbi:hypothetical protein TYRP_005913 [Tyrophagus putrescentiae]|nr:hypothetical protein TYRP_005913 [Tyrophagus putrescentiae]
MLLTAGFLAQGVVVTLKTTTNASVQIVITTLAAEGNGNSSSSTTSTATSDHSSPDENDQLVKHPFLLVVTLFTFSFTVCIMSACICLQRSSDRGHEEANLASMSVYKDAQEDLRKYISSIYEMKKPTGQAGATTKANRQGPSCRSVLEETAVPILEPKSRISSRKARSKVKSSKSGNV